MYVLYLPNWLLEVEDRAFWELVLVPGFGREEPQPHYPVLSFRTPPLIIHVLYRTGYYSCQVASRKFHECPTDRLTCTDFTNLTRGIGYRFGEGREGSVQSVLFEDGDNSC